MKIENNRIVSLIYELRESDSRGRLIEVLDENRPMTFIYGSGRLLPLFESHISCLSAGDKFDFTLVTDEAYGERREDMVINLPVSIFEKDGKIDENICRVGNEVPMRDKEGNRISGIINEITDSYLKMDFNHPMAGADLHFTGRIIDVREANGDELNSTVSSCSSCGSYNNKSGCSGPCS